jgi:hypothetical protein
MKVRNLPEGWTAAKVRQVLNHYESQSEDGAVADDEAALRSQADTSIRGNKSTSKIK